LNSDLVREVPCSVCGIRFWAELRAADQQPPYFCHKHDFDAPWRQLENHTDDFAEGYTRGVQDALKAVGDKWAARCSRAERALADLRDKMK
jgi:hypothetical protein